MGKRLKKRTRGILTRDIPRTARHLLCFILVFQLIMPVGWLAVLESRADTGGGGNSGGASPSTQLEDPAKVRLPSIEAESFTGSMRTSLPIELPPGRDGKTPDLSLVYDSNGALGPLGVGWSLQGVESVRRQAKFGCPTWSSTDEYELNGEKLVPISDGTYRTEHESFRRIKKLSKIWSVEHPDGAVQEFAKLETRSDGGVLRWHLTAQRDTYGSEVRYVYTDDYDSGSATYYPYLSDIKYPFQMGEGTPSSYYKVSFEYVTSSYAPANTTTYGGCFAQKPFRWLLRYIHVKWVEGGAETTIRKYQLDYGTSTATNRPRMTRITQTGLNNQGSLTTQFEYQSGSNTWTAQSWLTGLPQGDYDRRYTGDFNGDGREDLLRYDHDGSSGYGRWEVHLSNGQSFPSSPSWTWSYGDMGTVRTDLMDENKDGTHDGDDQVFVADFTGDGRDDVLHYVEHDSDFGSSWNEKWVVMVSSGTSFSHATGLAHDFDPLSGDRVFLGQFNRDLALDLLIYTDGRSGYSARWAVALWNGSSFTYSTWISCSDGQSCDVDEPEDGGRDGLFPGDYSGDGLLDVLFYRERDGQHTWYVYRTNSTLSGFTVSQWIFTGASSVTAIDNYPYDGQDESHVVGDFNGDGKADFLKVEEGGAYRVFLSTGVSFASPLVWATYDQTSFEGSTVAADMNGDGLDDLVERVGQGDTAKATVMYSTGSAFTAPTNSGGIYTMDNFVSDHGKALGDFNGDGRLDYLARDFHTGSDPNKSYDDTVDWYVSGTDNRVGSDLLQKVTNSLGGLTEVSYAASPRQPGADHVPFTLPVLSSLSAHDGVGDGKGRPSRSVAYVYMNGAFDSQRRVFRGFGTVTEVNNLSSEDGDPGEVTITEFYQDFKKAGLIKQKQVNGLWQMTRTYDDSDNAAPYYVMLTTGTEWTFDGGVQKTHNTVYGYDSYGNVTVKKDYGDSDVGGDEKTTWTQFYYPSNFTTDPWILRAPREERLYKNIVSTFSTSDTSHLGQTLFAYDGDTSFSKAPTKGKLTTLKKAVELNAYVTVSFEYDPIYGSLTAIVNPRGHRVDYAYDDTIQVHRVTETNALGHIKQVTPNFHFGRPASETDANGNTTSYEYDSFGRTRKVIGPLDTSDRPTKEYRYYDFGDPDYQRVLVIRRMNRPDDADEFGVWERLHIDGMGRVIQAAHEGAVPSYEVRVSYGYNRFGKVGVQTHPYGASAPTDPDGRVAYQDPPSSMRKTTSVHDARARLLSVQTADGKTWSQAYGSSTGGWTVRKTSPRDDGKTPYKDFVFNAYGKLISVTEYPQGSAAQTRYGYDVHDRLTKIQDAEQVVTLIDYDWLGRKLRIQDPDLRTWTYTYDSSGNLTSSQSPIQSQLSGSCAYASPYRTSGKTCTVYNYDKLDRIVQKSIPGEDVVSYTYDTHQGGNVPDARGLLTAVSSLTAYTEYAYTAEKRVRSVKRSISGDPTIYETQREYNGLGGVARITHADPSRTVVDYVYNEAGQVRSVPGYVDYISYTDSGQFQSIDYHDDSYTNYEYDLYTQRLSEIETWGIVNSAARTFRSVSYQWDPVGNLESTTGWIATGAQTEWEEILQPIETGDNLRSSLDQIVQGQPTGVEGAITPPTVDRTPEQAVQVENPQSDEVFPGGVERPETEDRVSAQEASRAGSSQTDRTSETVAAPEESLQAAGSPEAEKESPSGFFSCAHDWGREEKKEPTRAPARADSFPAVRSAGYSPSTLSLSQTFSYDELDQLTTASGPYGNLNYGYHPNGRFEIFEGKTVQYDPGRKPAHAISSLGGVTHEYDANGNRIKEVNTTTKAVLREYTYSQENRLTSVKDKVSGRTILFQYDGEGQRIIKNGDGGITNYIEDYVSDSGQGSAIYVRVNGLVLAKRHLQTNVQFSYHLDHLGGTQLVTFHNGFEGGVVVQEAYIYKPFGDLEASETLSEQDGGATRYLFTNQEMDPGARLYNFRARMYDAAVGQFITPDPVDPDLENPRTLHRYAYALNNPLRYTDPSGHFPWLAFLGSVLISGLISGTFSVVLALAMGERNWQSLLASFAGGFISGAIVRGAAYYPIFQLQSQLLAGIPLSKTGEVFSAAAERAFLGAIISGPPAGVVGGVVERAIDPKQSVGSFSAIFIDAGLGLASGLWTAFSAEASILRMFKGEMTVTVITTQDALENQVLGNICGGDCGTDLKSIESVRRTSGFGAWNSGDSSEEDGPAFNVFLVGLRLP